jgi:hypothetical protein
MDNQNQRVTEQADDYKLIAHLIGIIFFAGDFRAETANERQLEALLIKTGHRYRSWAEIDVLHDARQAAPEAPTAWLATDLDGRGDVAFTKEEAKRRAGEGCTEFFPLYDSAPATQQAGAAERAKELVEQYRTGYRHGYEEGRAELPAATTASASDLADRLRKRADSAYQFVTVERNDLIAAANALERAPAPSQEATVEYLMTNFSIGREQAEHHAAALVQQGAAQAAHAGAVDLDKLQRYGDNEWAATADSEFGPRASGEYVKLEDVRAAIAASQPQKGSEA